MWSGSHGGVSGRGLPPDPRQRDGKEQDHERFADSHDKGRADYPRRRAAGDPGLRGRAGQDAPAGGAASRARGRENAERP